MTTLVTRARLLSTVLRTGDNRRIRRIIERFETADLAHVLPALDHLDLRRLAAALCDNAALDQRILDLDAPSLARLCLAASPSDLERLLSGLSRADQTTCASVLMTLPEEGRLLAIEHCAPEVRADLIRALPRRARPRRNEDGLVAALRLQRLFA